MTSDYALGFYALLLLPCCHGVIRLGARHLSLELQYLFSNLLGLACACQTFTLSSRSFQLDSWSWSFSLDCPSWLCDSFHQLADMKEGLPFLSAGKSNITLPTNSQDLCSMQFSTVFKWALSQLGLLVTSIPSHHTLYSPSYCIFLHCIYYITYLLI